MRILKKIIIASNVLLIGILVFAVTPVNAQLINTDSAQQACEAVGSCDPNVGTLRITYIIGTVINLLSIALGVAAVIMIIIGGLKYITSNGDASSIGNAKNTIMYALIGLVVAAAAQIMVRLVLSRVSSVG